MREAGSSPAHTPKAVTPTAVASGGPPGDDPLPACQSVGLISQSHVLLTEQEGLAHDHPVVVDRCCPLLGYDTVTLFQEPCGGSTASVLLTTSLGTEGSWRVVVG